MKIRARLFLVVLFSISFTNTVHAQEPIYLADSTFSSVGQLPEFPGGESSLLQFIAKTSIIQKKQGSLGYRAGQLSILWSILKEI